LIIGSFLLNLETKNKGARPSQVDKQRHAARRAGLTLDKEQQLSKIIEIIEIGTR